MSLADYFTSLTNEQAIQMLAKMGIKSEPSVKESK